MIASRNAWKIGEPNIFKIIIFNCSGLNGGRINPIKCKFKTTTQKLRLLQITIRNSIRRMVFSPEFLIKCSTWNEHLNVLDLKNNQPYNVRIMAVNLCLVFIMQLLRNNGNGTAVQYKSIWMSMSIWCFNLWANVTWHSIAKAYSIHEKRRPIEKSTNRNELL